jgi:hypothetical protein
LLTVVTVLVLEASDCVVVTVVNATVDGDEPTVAGLLAGTIEINIYTDESCELFNELDVILLIGEIDTTVMS